MSTALLENSRSFPTISGFDVPAAALSRQPVPVPVPPPKREAGTQQLQGHQQQHLLPPRSPQQHAPPFVFRELNSPAQPQLQQQHPSSHTPPSVAATPTSDHLGWQGLLEISRNSGASGVLGVRAPDDEAEPARENKIELEICCTAHTTPAVRRLAKSVIRGLKACQEPEASTEGMGGTYFFMNESGQKAAILKPCDEEALAPNNPKGYVGRSLGDPGWKPTVRVGEAAMREVAAYLLDHESFAKVPASVLVRARHPIFCYKNRMSSVRASVHDLTITDSGPEVLPMKLGSLQEFVYHECDTSEMGPSRFSVKDVHRIGILDIRLFNTDRHAGNILVRTLRDSSSSANLTSRISGAQYELIPIDHGFCLPETLEAPYFEWLHWPQTMMPFGEEELAYIRRLDIEADKELLRKELPNLRPECLRLLELTTLVLQRGAEAGLTLFEIASCLSRPFEGGEEEPSDLEKFAARARQAVEEAVIEEGDEDGSEEDEDEADGSDGEQEQSESGSESSDLDGFDIRGRETLMLMEGRGSLPAVSGSLGAGSSMGMGTSMEHRMLSGAAVPVPAAAPAPAAAVAASSGRMAGGLSAALRTASSGGIPSIIAAAAAPSRGAEDSMLFDLEVDMQHRLHCNTSIGGRAPASNKSEGGLSPVSIGSSSLSSIDQFTFRGNGGTAAAGGDGPVTPLPPWASRNSNTTAGPQPVGVPIRGAADSSAAQMARSVHGTDGFLWRRMKGRQSHSIKQRHHGGHTTHKRLSSKLVHSPQAYPPAVSAFAPDSLSGLFSFMDESQWGFFMRVMDDQISQAVGTGQWRKQLKRESSVALSCPRF